MNPKSQITINKVRYKMFGFPQQILPVEICLICKQPCINSRFPLEFDTTRNVYVFACSTQCLQVWQNLVQALQQQQQQAMFQQMNPSFAPPVIPPQTTPPFIHQQQFQMHQQLMHQQQQPQHLLHPQQMQSSIRENHPIPIVNPPPLVSSPPPPIVLNSSTSSSISSASPTILPAASSSSSSSSASAIISSSSTSSSISTNTSNSSSSSTSTSLTPEVVQYKTLFVVVDTNVLLEHLYFILNLRHLESVTVVIPIVAIHELDGLKKSEDDSVATRSRNALKVIHEGLQENATKVKKWMRGQATHEILSSSDTMIMRNNDDQILNCSIWFSKFAAGPDDGVILATNDTGLSVKALMQGLEAKNVSQLSSALPAHNEPGTPLTMVIHSKMNIPSSVSASLASNAAFNQSMQNSSLPRENLPMSQFASIWKNILGRLPPRSLPKLTGVCFAFYQLINGDDDIWRASITSTFQDVNGILIPPETSPKQWYMKWRRQCLTISAKNI